eukprot:gene32035-38737_t
MRVNTLSCASFALASLSLSWTSLQQLLLEPSLHYFCPSTLITLFCDQNATEPEYLWSKDFTESSLSTAPPHAAICASLRQQLDQTYSCGKSDCARRTVHFTAVSEDSHQFSRRSVLYWSEVCGLGSMLSSIHLTTAPYSEHSMMMDGPSCVAEGSRQGADHGGDGGHHETLRPCDHVCNVRTVQLANVLVDQRGNNSSRSGYSSSRGVLDIYCVEDFFAVATQFQNAHKYPQSPSQPEPELERQQQDLRSDADVQWVYVPSLLLRRNVTKHHGLSQHNLASLYYELQHVLSAARNSGVSLRIEFLYEEEEEQEDKAMQVDGATSSEVDPSQLFPYTAPANLLSSQRDLGFLFRSWLFIDIVVYDFHEALARDFVELIKLHCMNTECESFMHFMIVTVDSSLDRRALNIWRRYQEYASLCINGLNAATSTSSIEYCEGGAGIVAEYLACVPSPITALQELSAHMKDSNTADDTVYFLPGLHALYSFPHFAPNFYVNSSRCNANERDQFHRPRGQYSLPPYVWPDGACKYAKVLQLWNVSGELRSYINLPSAVVLIGNHVDGGTTYANGSAAAAAGGKAYMGQAESVLAYSDLLLRCTSAHLRQGAYPAGSAGDGREEEKEWLAYEECRRWLYAKLQSEANGTYISMDRQAIFVPQEASLLLGLVSEQLLLSSAGGHEWLTEVPEMPISQFILHFFANQVVGVLRGRVHPAHESFVRPRSGPTEDASKKADLASLLRESRWLRGYDLRLEYVNATLADYLSEWIEATGLEGQQKNICNLSIDHISGFVDIFPSLVYLGFSYEKYSGFLFFTFMLDYVRARCDTLHIVSLFTKWVALNFYEAARATPLRYPALGESAAILSLMDHLRSTMLPEIIDANLHYSVNVVVPYFAQLINNHYAARRRFAYSVWLDGHATMRLTEVQQRRARMVRSYAFPPEKVRMYYATYASNASHEGLQWLLKTASIAGVRLQVLGQGEEYFGHGKKVAAYHDFVSSRGLSEEDVVVLLDGYDVLLFPSVRRLLSMMRSMTSKPIVVCADGGMYPELLSPYFYRHPAGSGASRSSLPLHFVNSGVIIGKVWALRLFFAWALQFADTVLCDQSLLNRHVLMVPDLYHIDSEQTLSSAGYKNHFLLNAWDTSNLLILDMSLKVRTRPANVGYSNSTSRKEVLRDVLILHTNVKTSNQLYFHITSIYGELFNRHFKMGDKVDVDKVRSMWGRIDQGVSANLIDAN